MKAERFVLPTGHFSFTLNGVAAGSYLATVDYATATPTATQVTLNVNAASAGTFWGPSNGTDAVVSGATAITVPTGGSVTISTGGAPLAGFTSVVTLTSQSKLTTGAVTGS